MNSLHLHLMLNHLPVVGALIGTSLLAFAFARGHREEVRWSLRALTGISLTCIPVYISGWFAERSIDELIQPKVSSALIEDHEQAATYALISLIAAGAIALLSLVSDKRTPSMAVQRLALPPLVVAVLACLLMFRAANFGGSIRHTEIGGGQAPSVSP